MNGGDPQHGTLARAQTASADVHSCEEAKKYRLKLRAEQLELAVTKLALAGYLVAPDVFAAEVDIRRVLNNDGRVDLRRLLTQAEDLRRRDPRLVRVVPV